MAKLQKPDPYCAFKNDVERRKALISRDIRIVLIVWIGTVVGASEQLKGALTWLRIFTS